MEKKTTEEIGEVLEAVWTLEEQGSATLDKVIHSAKTKVSDELLKKLESEGFLSVDSSGRLKLLPNGRQNAEKIIRQHRLKNQARD